MKRSISLIEVIICLGLISVLLSTLFFWYRTTTKQKEDFSHLKWPLQEERYAYQRLETIFRSIQLPLFTPQFDQASIVFTFDRGLNTIPELSGRVLGKLYFDQNTQCLCLGMWQLPTHESAPKLPTETVILLDDVSTCAFEFYNPPDPFNKPVDPEEVGKSRPAKGWQNTWKEGYHKLPGLVKIHITREKTKGLKMHKFVYAFDLPPKIIYPKEQQ